VQTIESVSPYREAPRRVAEHLVMDSPRLGDLLLLVLIVALLFFGVLHR
jgi:hypothetical protein